MCTFMITKDKKHETKHLLTHIPDPAKDTSVSTFFKISEKLSKSQILVTLKIIHPLCSFVLDKINQCASVNHPQVWILGAYRQNILHRGIENSFPLSAQ